MGNKILSVSGPMSKCLDKHVRNQIVQLSDIVVADQSETKRNVYQRPGIIYKLFENRYGHKTPTERMAISQISISKPLHRVRKKQNEIVFYIPQKGTLNGFQCTQPMAITHHRTCTLSFKLSGCSLGIVHAWG